MNAPASSARYGNYMRTFTGVKFYPLDPRPNEVRIVDVGHHLSQLCRFCGAIRCVYSVAEHSVRVAWAVERWALSEGWVEPYRSRVCLWALLHDASEAYTNDIVSPLKHDPKFLPVVAAEAAIMRAVCAEFGLSPEEPEIVTEMDKRMCVTEAEQLRHNNHSDLMAVVKGYEPIPGVKLRPWYQFGRAWGPRKARRKFLAEFERYGGGRYRDGATP